MPKSKMDLQQQVLKELRQHGNVSRAARAVGISRRTIHRWQTSDAVFRAAVTAALAEGRE